MTTGKERKFKDITAEFFQFEQKGDSIEGTLVAKGTVPFNRAGSITEVGKYTLETDDGERVAFLGGTVIDQTLEDIPLGVYLRVAYIGIKKTSNKMDMKDYTIEVAE